MAENKTQPTQASVEAYLDSRASPEQRADCHALMAMCARITGAEPVMWGPTIVGYGSYRYRYASGHSGSACQVGIAVRGRDLVLYLLADDEAQRALLDRLGKHRMGKACLYFKRLTDLDPVVLERLIAHSVAEIRRRHPDP